jgi:HAMP domain-containing protein
LSLERSEFGIAQIIRRSTLLVFVAALFAGSIAFFLFFNAASMRHVADEARAMMKTATAIREYTVEQITPLLAQLDSLEFYPESVPSFAAQTVFQRISGDLTEYTYREAALNPTNPNDLAEQFEADLINRFQAAPDVTELTGLRDVNGDRQFYVAQPIIIRDTRCLVCHSTPDAAPASMIAAYGDQNGFGWQVGEVVAVQLLSIPVGDEMRSIYELVAIFFGMLVILFILVSVAVTLPLRRNIIEPLRRLAQVAERSSLRDDTAPLPEEGAGEIKQLAAAISRLRTSLHLSMNGTDRHTK